MSQEIQKKIVSRSVDLLLKKDSDFHEESTVKLIEGIKEKTHWVDPKTGETIDIKDLTLGEMVERDLKRVGQSGWHNFEDAFTRKWTSQKFSGDGHVDKALNEAYQAGQNDFGNVFAKDKPCRSISVGDVLVVQEWGSDGIQVGRIRHFMVADVGFDEFDRATGEFL